MIRYIIKRILLMIPVIWGVVTLIFLINTFAPGDPATQILGTSATEEQKAVLREDLGLNDPTIVQYFTYLKNLVLRGDMGISYSSKQSVSGEIASKFPTTLKLAGFCTIWSILVGVPMGIASAVKRYTWVDNLAMTFALVAVSIPTFWLGIMMIIVFSVKLHWLPSFGVDNPLGWILPTVALSVMSIAQIARTTRSSML